MTKKLNADAAAAVASARKGNCRDAMKYLYDASPHMQQSCSTPGFEDKVADYRHASIIVAGACTRNASKSTRHDQQGFDGPRRRRKHKRR